MTITVACPSYHRAHKLETPEYLPYIKVCVAEFEADEYKAQNPDVDFVVCPDSAQGNLCRVRNWMIDQLLPECDCLVLLDDDLQYIARYENGEVVKLNASDCQVFFEKYAIMAQDLGAKLWGLNVNSDRQVYREMTPFSLVAYIGGPFQGIMAGQELRYDEALPLKEDYDFSLQNLNRYRKVLRVNKAFYSGRQVEQEGGCSTYRTIKRELDQMKALQRKWGEKIVRTHERDRNISKKNNAKTKRIEINPMLSIPIRGT